MSPFPLERITPLRQELENHPLYAKIADRRTLCLFMEHHIYSVWDFMSLLKALQHHIAPSRSPWVPANTLQDHPRYSRFITDIVIEEECDEGLPDRHGRTTYASHFELYLQAMREAGADCRRAERFVENVRQGNGMNDIKNADIPEPARKFMQQTFSFLDLQRPHVIAAAFALGREHIIPAMFRALLDKMAIRAEEAPAFHYYLERHIHLDGDHHGPLSLSLLEQLCGTDQQKIAEAEEAAQQAIQARMTFWDGVLAAF